MKIRHNGNFFETRNLREKPNENVEWNERAYRDLYGKLCENVESESGRIVSGFFGKLAYPDKDFEISVRQIHQMELKRCPLNRARRFLPGKWYEKVGKHFWANRDRYSGIPANSDQDFAISSHQERRIELEKVSIG